MSRAPLLCVGDPLLDIQVRNAEDLITKYGLRANDALRATPELLPLYDEITRREPAATLVAGGAAQNTARAAAYILPPNSVVYSGCVGADERADFLKEANEREAVRSAYNVHPTLPTGACAVLLTGQDRSLVTNLGAAGAYNVEHFRTPEMVDILAGAKIIYTTGFFLANSLEGVLFLARHAAEHNQTFVLNISAPFIPRLHFSKFAAVFPFCDMVLGNDADARAWAVAAGLQPAEAVSGSSSYLSLASIANTIATLPFDAKKSSSARRTVILTNGPEPTVLTQYPGGLEARTIAAPKVAAGEVVDTNGAGDAFAGGLFAGLLLGKDLEESVTLGHRMGAMSVRHVGPQYTFPKVDVLSNL